MRNGVAGVLLALVLSDAGLAADFETNARKIVEEERALAGAPAMSVAVFAGGRTVLLYASGMADVETHTPATPKTLFQAASVTKILTAALVMHEVEQGRLSLDTPVNDRLPPQRRVRDAAGAPVPVTLRQLLSHSSGLGVSGAGIQREANGGMVSLDEHLSHGLITVEPAGKKLIYSNDAFALAGWLAGQAEGKSYQSLGQDVLLGPLGMKDSTFKTPNEAGPGLAAAYGDLGLTISHNRVAHQAALAIAPAGALITTADDLGRFGLAMLGGGQINGVRVLSAPSVEEMMRLGVRAHPRMPEGFGLGFGVRDSPGRKLVWWDGLLSGATATLALLPEHGAGIAVLCNLPDIEAVENVSTRILALLVPPPAQHVVPVDTATLASDAGRFRLLDLLDRRLWYINWLVEAGVQAGAGELVVEAPLRRTPGRFVPVGPGLFQAKGKSDGSYLTFDGDKLFVAYLQGRRIPAWQTARSITVFASAVALVLLSLLVWGLVRVAHRVYRRVPYPRPL